jgi:hypothetical protein
MSRGLREPFEVSWNRLHQRWIDGLSSKERTKAYEYDVRLRIPGEAEIHQLHMTRIIRMFPHDAMRLFAGVYCFGGKHPDLRTFEQRCERYARRWSALTGNRQTWCMEPECHL